MSTKYEGTLAASRGPTWVVCRLPGRMSRSAASEALRVSQLFRHVRAATSTSVLALPPTEFTALTGKSEMVFTALNDLKVVHWMIVAQKMLESDIFGPFKVRDS